MKKKSVFPCRIIDQLITSPRKQAQFIKVMNHFNFMLEINNKKETFSVVSRREEK